MVRVNISLSPEQLALVKLLAKLQNKTHSQIIREAIDLGLKQIGKEIVGKNELPPVN